MRVCVVLLPATVCGKVNGASGLYGCAPASPPPAFGMLAAQAECPRHSNARRSRRDRESTKARTGIQDIQACDRRQGLDGNRMESEFWGFRVKSALLHFGISAWRCKPAIPASKVFQNSETCLRHPKVILRGPRNVRKVWGYTAIWIYRCLGGHLRPLQRSGRRGSRLLRGLGRVSNEWFA